MGLGQSVEDLYFPQKVKLGQGGFGTVWRAIDRKTNRFVAVKQIDKLKAYWQGAKRSELLMEIDILRACNHLNVTKLYNCFEDSATISIAMEYCDGGDLDDKLKERGWKVPEEQAARWMHQICSAIGHLHARNICHRDIKPGNFMLAMDVLKLSDFGFATFLKKEETSMEDVGTPAFMAPEQHLLKKGSRSGYGHPVDVWAAGCTLHMLISGGRHPFVKGKSTLDMPNLLEGNLDFGLSMFGDLMGSETPARSLCRRMVCPDLKTRLTIEETLTDPWLQASVLDAGLQPSRVLQDLGGDPAERYQQLEQQLLLAEKQLKEAEERELSLKSKLQKQEDSVVLISIPITLPECMNRCTSCTSFGRGSERLDRERVMKYQK
ncbi:unnamed protein product [Durusdinium trenchii]|uniref:Protein kinase domain-containing protein n=1 Tax=Durusdinium trenchii TaxID=1381693 RepID=A0ABP0L5S9_9DINO